mgnify:CR=1 FL=1
MDSVSSMSATPIKFDELGIDVLLAGGYTNLIAQYLGEGAYSYVFDGQLGYLIASGAPAGSNGSGRNVTGTDADSPSLKRRRSTGEDTFP